MPAAEAGASVPGYACFPTPILDASLAERAIPHGGKLHRADRSDDAVLSFLGATDSAVELARLSEREIVALERLIPSLLCGEESAVIIFQHEGKRYGRSATTAHLMRRLQDIAGEEERHEVILNYLLRQLPPAPDAAAINERSRGFFVKLGFQSGDPIHRLNHIGALDRCVSITLGAMAKSASAVRSPVFATVVNRIRNDEARHVKISRGIMQELGVSRRQMRDADDVVRAMYVELMAPLGAAFEDVAIDPDRLFAALSRSGDEG
jgi:hypothetical protein